MTATSHVPRASDRGRAASIVTGVLAWAGAVVYPVLVLMATFNGGAGGGLILAALAFLPYWLLRRQAIPALLLMIFGTLLVSSTVHQREIGYTQIAVLDLAVGLVAATHRRLVSVIAATLAILGLLGAATLYTRGSNDFIATNAFIILSSITAWLIGDAIRVRREHGARLRSEEAARAVVDERLRIARELHDVVAHSIGIIAIQAGVGARVIRTQPEAARSALATIEATSRETLAGLRRTLGALRRSEHAPLEPAPGLADIDNLAESTLAAGVNVDVRWEGRPRATPADVGLSAYRIVQEALTNVVRHSGAAECRVSIRYGESDVQVEVVDDGSGGPIGEPGYGLIGMRERVALLGGHLSAGPRAEGGFRVTATLPLATGSAAPLTTGSAAPLATGSAAPLAADDVARPPTGSADSVVAP